MKQWLQNNSSPAVYYPQTQEISINYCNSSTTHNHHHIDYHNSHLFTLKTIINGNEIKILVDPGGDRTIISPSLLKKVATTNQGCIPLNINTITGKKKSIQGNIYSLVIPSKEGDINIYG